MRPSPDRDCQSGCRQLRDALWPALGAAVILLLMAVGYAPVQASGRQCGIASFYSYTGHRTASGVPYTGNSMTAAHRTLPFGTRVRVTDMRTGRAVVVVIDDRGPWVRGRILDLSRAAARAIGLSLGRVCIERVG